MVKEVYVDQKPRQVHTERGDIYVERTFRSKEEASAEGYYYSFRSSELGKDLFSKTLDDRGLRHSFAIVESSEYGAPALYDGKM